ncbi:hypothetical protein QQG74_09610 [Micromonospora sp. FIMYZ51]|uniref:phage tail tube protein n=1 Tax=Micromonospora sp. FIMYZ51 TaxID=3051832 RepID=UPI00311ECF43
MSQPLGVNTNGTIMVLWVPAIANLAAPTVAELTAESVLDLTCYLTSDGFTLETTENTVEDGRLCSKQVFEARGDYTDSMEFTYVFNTASPANDEARITLVSGALGNIVTRWAVDFEDAIAAADLVDVAPVEMGIQRKQAPTRNGMHRITQKPFIIGQVRRDVAVVAGGG